MIARDMGRLQLTKGLLRLVTAYDAPVSRGLEFMHELHAGATAGARSRVFDFNNATSAAYC